MESNASQIKRLFGIVRSLERDIATLKAKVSSMNLSKEDQEEDVKPKIDNKPQKPKAKPKKVSLNKPKTVNVANILKDTKKKLKTEEFSQPQQESSSDSEEENRKESSVELDVVSE